MKSAKRFFVHETFYFDHQEREVKKGAVLRADPAHLGFQISKGIVTEVVPKAPPLLQSIAK